LTYINFLRLQLKCGIQRIYWKSNW